MKVIITANKKTTNPIDISYTPFMMSNISYTTVQPMSTIFYISL